MEQLIEIIQANILYAPYIIFGALLLAGLNIPVSEDVMLFISAILAAKNPDLFYHFLIGVYLGAYLSDLICYWLGRKLGNALWKIKFFAKMISREKVDKISNYYNKYGVITLIFGRFIPFGVRNGLFLTAGLGKMNFLKFALSDLLACTISTIIFFSLYYNFGEMVVDYVKKGNIILFSVVAVLVVSGLLIKKLKARKVKV